MNTNNYRKVSSVGSTLQAVTVQNMLENAGIPVSLSNSRMDGGLDILTPEEWVFEAQILLNPERMSGEIYRIGQQVRRVEICER